MNRLNLIVAGVIAAETCFLPVDVYFVQDTTGSFIDDLPNVKRQIPTIIERINESNPGSAFGVAEFRDKPYFNLGELSDFCYKLAIPLSTDIAKVEQSFEHLFASGGRDLPEAQFHALIDAVNDPMVGWRSLGSNVDGSQAGAKLIILSTDAKPHDPGDYELYPDTAPATMIPFPDSVSGMKSDTLCRRYDYPSVNQMKEQLNSHNTYLAILTPSDATDATMTEVVAKWRWINDEVMGNPAEFYQYIESDSSNILDAIVSVLKGVTNYVCALTTTQGPTTVPTTVLTTDAPTTTPTTTAAPTTVPATTTAAATTVPATTAAATTIPITTVAPTTVPTTTAAATTAVPTTVPTTTAATTLPVTTAAPTTAVAPTTVPTPTEAATTAPATTVQTTVGATTTVTITTKPEVTVTPAGPTEITCPPQECKPECVPNCGNKYGLVIKANDRPKKLVVDYEK